MAGPLVVIGDALLDTDVDGLAERLCPDAPVPVIEDACERRRPGGAALAALLAAAAASEVVLVAPFGADPASECVRALLPGGVTVIALPLDGRMQEKTRLRASGRTLLRVDRGSGNPGPAGPAAIEAIMAAGALLVCDYGRGTAAGSLIREALCRRAAQAPLVWDPHPRGTAPVPGTHVATPNHAEAARAAGHPAGSSMVVDSAAAAERLLGMWRAQSVAVTLGSHGALLARNGQAPLVIPAEPLDAIDPCGAGDQFAVTTALALREGALVSEAVTAGVAAATHYLAGGGVSSLTVSGTEAQAGAAGKDAGTAGPDGKPGEKGTASVVAAAVPKGPVGTAPPGGWPAGRDASQMASLLRARGGTVVAAGGCFDVLHAGHVAMLHAARSLGDCLLVCINSDASVRRLKGPGRPLNPAADRAAVLAALDCVDQVLVFDEDTPERLLSDLRPHIWVKGGDYDGREMPEAAVMRRWRGQVVTVPYLTGRSTSRLAAAAAHTGQHASRR